MYVKKRDGSKQNLDLNKIHQVLEWACKGDTDDTLSPIRGVSVSEVEMRAHLHFFPGITTKQIHECLIKAASELISEDTPNYDHVAARLRWFSVRKEAFGDNLPPDLLTIVKRNTSNGVYHPEVLGMYTSNEWGQINAMIDHRRDDLFRYAGAEQMSKKYLVQNRKTKQIYETFQIPYIMVAAILFNKYPVATRLSYVKRYYDAVSTHYVSLPTPIMAGLRTKVKQFSSCTVIEVGDSLESIVAGVGAIVDYASRKAGIGLNIGQIRAAGQPVRGGDAVTTGILPFSKLFAAALKSCSQGAVRGASATFSVPVFHLEFETLIELKNNKGTEETRLRTVDYCIQLNKTMYERFIENKNITLFSPDEVPELYKAFFGDPDVFKVMYEQCEKNQLLTKKSLPAREIFGKIMQERFDTGRIYIMNADHCNTHGSFYEPIKMTNLCLTGDNMIPTNTGLRKLEDLYKSQEEFSVFSDIRALEGREVVVTERCLTAWDKPAGVQQFQSSKVALTNVAAKVIKVRTMTGFSTTLTPNHLIMTPAGWKEAGKLAIGDALYVQSGEVVWPESKPLPIPEYEATTTRMRNTHAARAVNLPTEWTEDLGVYLGWLIGDGYFSQATGHPSLVFGNMDGDVIPLFERLFAEWLPDTKIRQVTYFETTTHFHAHDHRFSKWLGQMGVSAAKSSGKTVPTSLFTAPRHAVVGFLKGLFSADGTIDSGKEALSISLTSVSTELLKGVQLLLLNLGIRSRVYPGYKAGPHTLPDSNRVPRSYECKVSYCLKIGKANRNKFMEEVGFLQDYKNDGYYAYFARRGPSPRMDTYVEKFMDEVVEISYAGVQPVYDISVEDSHSLIANGIVVHNCVEITLPTTPIGNDDSLVSLCTLSAINWGKIRNEAEMAESCELSVRGLDALLDYQEYPQGAAERSTRRYRPLGVGLIGFAHYLAKRHLKWGAEDTLVAIEETTEQMAYYLTKTSLELAKEFGPCETRTKYHDGILPIDTSFIPANTKLDWELLRVGLREYGIRNATLMAGMPSETSSQLSNETNGFEPPKSLISIKSSKDGIMAQVVPEYIKLGSHYETAWNVSVPNYLKTVAVFQKYFDQSLSSNTTYNPSKNPVTMTTLMNDLLLGYKLGVKTLYYNNTFDGSGEDMEDESCEGGACKI